MASLERSIGGKCSDPHLPRAVEGGIRGSSSFFGSGSRRGGDAEGGSLGALRSSWISRLRPPPRARSPFLPAVQRVSTAAAAQPAWGRGAVPTHEPGTRAQIPARDLGGRAFLGERPPPPHAFSPRLLSRDATAAAAAASSSSHMLQQQWRGAEAEQGKRRGEVAREEKEERGDTVAGFGPFQVRVHSAPLLLVAGLKQQQGHPEWKLEGKKAGGARRSCRPVAGVFPGRGNCRSFAGDGSFPFFQRMTRLGVVRGEMEEVAERDEGEEGLLVKDEGGRVSSPPDTGQHYAVKSNGCSLRESSFFRQRGSLCMSPNIRVPGDIGGHNAAESSQIIKNNQWLGRHRWGENSKHLDYYPASSPWPVGNGSISHPQVRRTCVGPRGVVDQASHRRLHDQHNMASAQGAAYKDTTDDTTTTRISYDIPNSNEVVQQQFVIKSSFWNIERIERARIVSSFCPSLAFDRGVGMKRILDPDVFTPSKSRKLRIRD